MRYLCNISADHKHSHCFTKCPAEAENDNGHNSGECFFQDNVFCCFPARGAESEGSFPHFPGNGLEYFKGQGDEDREYHDSKDKPAGKGPRFVRKAVYDDFGEPVRWEWVEQEGR